jgi:hypothetical protein
MLSISYGVGGWRGWSICFDLSLIVVIAPARPKFLSPVVLVRVSIGPVPRKVTRLAVRARSCRVRNGFRLGDLWPPTTSNSELSQAAASTETLEACRALDSF